MAIVFSIMFFIDAPAFRKSTTLKKTNLSPQKRILFVAFYFLILLMIFGIFEMVVRYRYPVRRDLLVLTGRIAGKHPMQSWALIDPYCAYRPKPDVTANGKTVNRHGFMSTPEITPEKPQNTCRIVFLGGSSTAGTGFNLKDTETWPWKTIALLKKNSTVQVDFINAAAGGYCSFESYGRLWSQLRYYQPDIIVVYHGWNDLYYFNRDSMFDWRMRPDSEWTFEKTIKPVKTYEPYWFDPFIYQSQLLTRLRLKLSHPLPGELSAGEPLPMTDDFNHDNLEIWRLNLQLIREAARLMGAQLLVVKQATLIVPDLPEAGRQKCNCQIHGFGFDSHVEAYKNMYRIIDEEIPSDAVIDATPLSGRIEFFYDHVHLNPEGTGALADIVAPKLIEMARNGS